jgi:hypothetical protein
VQSSWTSNETARRSSSTPNGDDLTKKKKKKKKETHQTKTNKHEYLFDRQVQAQSCDVDSSDSDGATASVWSQAMTRMHSGAPNRPASARTVSRAPSATAKLRR